jgi:hypothetical protein
MNNIGVGFTVVPDPREAAAYMVEHARANLSGRPNLALLFSTTDYDTESLVMNVQKELGDVPIWGGSSSTGVFANDRWVTGDKGAAALMLIANRPAGAGVACVEDDPVRAGKEATLAAVKQAGGDVNALLTLAFMGPEEKLLEGVMQVAPGVPVVGGTASDHHAESKFFQYGDGHAQMGAFTLGAVGGEIGYAFAHGYRLTGKKAVITKAAGRRIMTLDNRPALDKYCEWTNQKKADLLGSAILVYSVYHPILMHKGNVTLCVHPVGGNEDGTIDTGVAIVEGTTLELGESTPEELIHAVAGVIRSAAKNVQKPEAVILSHCGGRAIGLGDRIGEVAGEVRKAVGEVPWIGYLAFGEQGCPIPGEASHANLSLSALVLGSKN